MRFTLCSIASAALLLGSCPEPVQATSLLAQYDSQGAFNELLQLDAGLDLEADVEDGKTADAQKTSVEQAEAKFFDRKWAAKPKEAENLAKATEDFVNHLAKLHVKYLYQQPRKVPLSQSDYCEDGAKLEAEVKKVAPGIVQKLEAMRDAIDKADESRVNKSGQFKTFATKEDLAQLVGAETDFEVEENHEKFDPTVRLLQKKSLEDFKKNLGEDFDNVNGTIKMKDALIKGAEKPTTRETKMWYSVNRDFIDGVNAWAGLQSGTVEGGNDTRSYYGTELYARTLIKKSCEPEDFKKPTQMQVMKVSRSDLFLHNLEVLM